MTLGDEAHELRDVDGVPSVWLHSGGDCELAGSRYYQSALERAWAGAHRAPRRRAPCAAARRLARDLVTVPQIVLDLLLTGE